MGWVRATRAHANGFGNRFDEAIGFEKRAGDIYEHPDPERDSSYVEPLDEAEWPEGARDVPETLPAEETPAEPLPDVTLVIGDGGAESAPAPVPEVTLIIGDGGEASAPAPPPDLLITTGTGRGARIEPDRPASPEISPNVQVIDHAADELSGRPGDGGGAGGAEIGDSAQRGAAGAPKGGGTDRGRRRKPVSRKDG